MKHAFTKGLFVAATATLIAACSTDDAADQLPVQLPAHHGGQLRIRIGHKSDGVQ